MTNCTEESKMTPDWKKVFVSREEFLKLICVACSGLIGLVVTIPGLAFAFNYLFVSQGREWIKVGQVENFKEGETVHVVFKGPYALPWDGVSATRAAWLRREKGDEFTAFAITCTHLGCPIRWQADAELFMCPCHGGVFYKDGEVAAGPPPRPLHRFPVRINKGQIEIQLFPVLVKG